MEYLSLPKRFQDSQKASDNRLEDTQKVSNKRFDASDKRFEDLQMVCDKSLNSQTGFSETYFVD